MKKPLVLTIALFCVCAVSNASIFKCWLAPGTVNSSGYYPVQIWGEILPDPAIPDEDITDSGFCDFAITIYTPGTVGATAPRTNAGSSVVTSFSGGFIDWTIRIPAAAQDYDQDGDLDAVELALGDTDGLDLTIGTSGPVLIATETWKNLGGGQVTLTPYIADSSRHWNPDGITRSVFTGYQAVSTTFTLPLAGHPVVSAPAKINTSSGSLTATRVPITVTMSDGSSAGGTLNFGDGTSVTFTSTPFTALHDYTISGGTTSQPFVPTAIVSGAGGTESGNATTNILEAPGLILLVNGVAATNGQVFDGPEFYGHNTVTLTIIPTGYVEDGGIVLPGSTGDVGMTWTGDTYDLYGGSVMAGVSNTGLGLNMASISVTFVPEPATLALLVIGATGAFLRRRK